MFLKDKKIEKGGVKGFFNINIGCGLPHPSIFLIN